MVVPGSEKCSKEMKLERMAGGCGSMIVLGGGRVCRKAEKRRETDIM